MFFHSISQEPCNVTNTSCCFQQRYLGFKFGPLQLKKKVPLSFNLRPYFPASLFFFFSSLNPSKPSLLNILYKETICFCVCAYARIRNEATITHQLAYISHHNLYEVLKLSIQPISAAKVFILRNIR